MASKAYLEKKNREIERHKQAQENARNKERVFGQHVDTAVGSVSNLIGNAFKAAANDVAWYKTWPCDYDRYLNLPTFKNRALATLADSNNVTCNPGGSGVSVTSNTINVPIIISLNEVPRLGQVIGNSGVQTTVDFPINNALSMMLTQIGKVNSRTVKADPDVLGLYIHGTGEILRFLTWLRVNLEIVGKYSESVPALRDGLLQARGISSSQIADFVNNVANYRKLYNAYAVKFNTEFAIPHLSYYLRKAFIASAIFMDQDINKAQIITFNRWKCAYGAVTADVDGISFTIPTLNSITQYRTALELMFNRILYDGDFNELISNIRAAYSPSSMLQIPNEVGDFLTTIPVNDLFLSQLHNIRTLPYAPYLVTGAASNSNVAAMITFINIATTGTGLVQPQSYTYAGLDNTTTEVGDCWVAAAARGSGSSGYDFLDLYTDKVTHDDLIECTRLHPAWNINTSQVTASGNQYASSGACTIYGEGTELILFAQLWGNNNGTWIDTPAFSYMPAMPTSSINTHLRQLVGTQAIDWIFPIYAVCSSTGTAVSTRSIYSSIMNQFGNYFNVDYESIKGSHYLCDQSLYYVDPASFKYQGR